MEFIKKSVFQLKKNYNFSFFHILNMNKTLIYLLINIINIYEKKNIVFKIWNG